MAFGTDDCPGTPDDLCGPCVDVKGNPVPCPCCDFHEDAFLDASMQGTSNPCTRGAFWTTPLQHPETGIWSCEYSEMAFAEDDFLHDSLTGADPFAEEYWSERFDLEPLALAGCAIETVRDMNARCPPPGIWAGRPLPTQAEVDQLTKNVDIQRGFYAILGSAADDDASWEECERPLIEVAWALFRSNDDLVWWIVCLVTGLERGLQSELHWQACFADYYGRSSLLENINTLLDPLTPFDLPFSPREFEIVLASDTWMLFGDSYARSQLLAGGGMTIDRSTQRWEAARTMFCSGDSGKKACAVIDIAALIFHEMLHNCGRDLSHGADECSFTDVAENLFRWAMAQRYPVATTPVCCQVGNVEDAPSSPIVFPDRAFAPTTLYLLSESC